MKKILFFLLSFSVIFSSYAEDADILNEQINFHKKISSIAKSCDEIILIHCDISTNANNKKEIKLKNKDIKEISLILKNAYYKKSIAPDADIDPAYVLELLLVSKKDGRDSITIYPNGEIPDFIPIEIGKENREKIKKIIIPYIKNLLKEIKNTKVLTQSIQPKHTH